MIDGPDWPVTAEAAIVFLRDGLDAWRTGLDEMSDEDLDTVGRSAYPEGLARSCLSWTSSGGSTKSCCGTRPRSGSFETCTRSRIDRSDQLSAQFVDALEVGLLLV